MHRASVIAARPVETGGMQLRVLGDALDSESIEPKDSIAINGVCLTLTSVDGDRLDFDVVPETLLRSTLGSLQSGESVNLELALRLGDRIGGHFVYGHVDATAPVIQRVREGQGERVRVGAPSHLARMICEKAFVAVDGVSVTVASTGAGYFDIALIPQTLASTTLGRRQVGDNVNLEVDPLARYAAAAVDTQR